MCSHPLPNLSFTFLLNIIESISLLQCFTSSWLTHWAQNQKAFCLRFGRKWAVKIKNILQFNGLFYNINFTDPNYCSHLAYSVSGPPWTPQCEWSARRERVGHTRCRKPLLLLFWGMGLLTTRPWCPRPLERPLFSRPHAERLPSPPPPPSLARYFLCVSNTLGDNNNNNSLN